jgi:hypothetical protein
LIVLNVSVVSIVSVVFAVSVVLFNNCCQLTIIPEHLFQKIRDELLLQPE